MRVVAFAAGLLTACAGLAADQPGKPKVPAGRDTTYVAGPIDRDGFIDYEIAINEEFGRGVTAETNSNALLWTAFGPLSDGAKTKMPAEYFRRLGITEPPPNGNYLTNIAVYLRDHKKWPVEKISAGHDLQGEAARRPWTAKDYPDVAGWLTAVDKPLTTVAEAVQRPRYYNPLVAAREPAGPGPLDAALLPSIQRCREAASALATRATLRLGEGKETEAWADLLACHRLARHLSHGATLIEALVAYAIHAVACNSTLTYLEHADLTADRYVARLKELRALPPLVPLAKRFEVGERLFGLDSIQRIHRQSINPKGKMAAALDWTAAMRNANGWYDKMAEAMKFKNRPDREKAFDALDKQFAELKKAKAPDPEKAGAGEAVAKHFSDHLMGLVLPAARKAMAAADRAEQVERNLHAACALAAYRKAEGKYPAALTDLAPKYLPAAPEDVFTGRPLVYKPGAGGYLLYSVGVNEKDDGGRTFGDDPTGDDLVVRIPRPEPKK